MNRQQLIKQIFDKKSLLCIGLDPDIKEMPPRLLHGEDPIFAFNKAIIDATVPYCAVYKPNLTFYEYRGVEGLASFEKTVGYLKAHYPSHFIIADAKRGDIGNTSAMYAKVFLEEYDVDTLTVAPYMGEDSATPFFEYEDKWVVVLALANNKGSHDFQLMENKNGEKLFEKVIKTSQPWGTDQNMMYVVGATQGSMFEATRRVAPYHFLLVPGVDAQGGSLQNVCQYGVTKGCGLLVNSSRGIIYASQGEDFADAVARSAMNLQQEIEKELERLSSRK